MIAAAQALVAKTGDAKIAEICTFQGMLFSFIHSLFPVYLFTCAEFFFIMIT
jgi:hypothetical protein